MKLFIEIESACISINNIAYVGADTLKLISGEHFNLSRLQRQRIVNKLKEYELVIEYEP